MNLLMTLGINELNVRYSAIRDIPLSHQEAIAWVLVNENDYTRSWSANDYTLDLELSITSNYPSELMPVNGDKRGGSIGPWYSKDCVYHDEVFIDITHIEVALEGYSMTVSVTIPRDVHTARTIAQMIAIIGFNAIDGYRISDRVSNGGQIY